MKKIYEFREKGMSIVIYRNPLIRAAMSLESGYVLDISDGKTTARYPDFPGLFNSLDVLKYCMKSVGEKEGLLAQSLFLTIKREISINKKSRLYARDTLRLLTDELVAYEKALEECSQKESSMEQLKSELAVIKEIIADKKKKEVVVSSLLQQTKFLLADTELEKRRLERMLGYAKPLKDLPEYEVIAIAGILDIIIPPRSTIPVNERYHETSAAHHMPAGYDNFVSRLRELDYVNRVNSIKQTYFKNHQIVRAIPDRYSDFVVTYGDEYPFVDVLVKTTASSEIQAKFVGECLKQIAGKKKRLKSLNAAAT